MKKLNGFKPHKIVTLVGSTKKKWQKRYAEVNRGLTLNGFVVISVAIFRHHIPNIEDSRDVLESIHYQKIRLADAVVLIHKDAMEPHSHTKLEIDYCKKIGKPVFVFGFLSQTLAEIRETLGEYETRKWKENLNIIFESV